MKKLGLLIWKNQIETNIVLVWIIYLFGLAISFIGAETTIGFGLLIIICAISGIWMTFLGGSFMWKNKKQGASYEINTGIKDILITAAPLWVLYPVLITMKSPNAEIIIAAIIIIYDFILYLIYKYLLKINLFQKKD